MKKQQTSPKENSHVERMSPLAKAHEMIDALVEELEGTTKTDFTYWLMVKAKQLTNNDEEK